FSPQCLAVRTRDSDGYFAIHVFITPGSQDAEIVTAVTFEHTTSLVTGVFEQDGQGVTGKATREGRLFLLSQFTHLARPKVNNRLRYFIRKLSCGGAVT